MTKITPAAKKARNSAWIARTAFGSGLALSLLANVWASSDHGAIGIVSGLWSPLALLLALSVIETANPKTRGGLVRIVGIAVIAAIAAWVSYWHLVDFFRTGGVDDPGAHLLPITVDVLMALVSPSMKRKVAPVARARKAPAKKAPLKILKSA